jgi:hypothetical protein
MKNPRIKEVAFLCVLFLGLAVVANADQINLISTGGTTGSFDFTAFINRTINVSSSGFDKLVIDVSAITGVETGFGINAVGGTWTAPGSKGYLLPSNAEVAAYNTANTTTYDWGSWTTSLPPTVVTASGLTSSVNLPSYVDNKDANGNPLDISRTLGTGTPEEFSAFEATWYGSGALTPTTTPVKVATLYVPTGWTPNGVIYSGAFGFSSSTTENSTLVVAPEPATLVLLGTALIGLAAYAWRKRK